MYGIYEHFLAIGMIKTSLDYVYDEVKEWHITRDKFNETFVTALYKQIKSDYCNTFSGKDRIFIEEIKGSDYVIDSNLEPVHRSNILIFSHKDRSKNELIQKQLESENIFIALREGFLRLAPHIFNNESDILALTEALKKFDLFDVVGKFSRKLFEDIRPAVTQIFGPIAPEHAIKTFL